MEITRKPWGETILVLPASVLLVCCKSNQFPVPQTRPSCAYTWQEIPKFPPQIKSAKQAVYSGPKENTFYEHNTGGEVAFHCTLLGRPPNGMCMVWVVPDLKLVVSAALRGYIKLVGGNEDRLRHSNARSGVFILDNGEEKCLYLDCESRHEFRLWVLNWSVDSIWFNCQFTSLSLSSVYFIPHLPGEGC